MATPVAWYPYSMFTRLQQRFFSFLRTTERYTKTDMVYLTTGGFWLGVGQVAASFSSFILAIAFANLLSPETFGTYKFILSTVGILAIPTLGGINTALSQAIARGVEGSLLPGLFTKIRWGLAGTLGSLALAGYYAYNENLLLASCFLVAAPFIPFFQTLGLYQAYLQSKRLFREGIFYSVLQRLLLVGVLVVVAVFAHALIPVLIAYFASLTIINLVFLLRTLKRRPPNTVTEENTIRYGKHLSFTDIIGTVGAYLDSLLLFHYLGPVYVAQYALARAPIDQMLSLYSNFPALAGPKLANRTVKAINSMFATRIFQLSVVAVVMAGAYVFIAPYVYQIFFSQYLESIKISQWLALTLVLQLPLTFLSAIVESRLNQLPVSWLYLRPVPQSIYIIALLALVPFYGIWGAVMGRIVLSLARLAVQLTQWIVFSRRVPIARTTPE